MDRHDEKALEVLTERNTGTESAPPIQERIAAALREEATRGDKMREALCFYADPANWRSDKRCISGNILECWVFSSKFGNSIAIEALSAPGEQGVGE